MLASPSSTSGYDAANRIRYYGFALDPTAVQVANIQFGYQHGNYCTARWLSVPYGITGCYEVAGMSPVADSIVKCVTLNGGFGLRGNQGVADSLSITGTVTDPSTNNFVDISGERDHYNGTIGEWTIGASNNVFSNSTVNMVVNTTTGPGDLHGIMVSAAAYNKILNNTFNFTINACYGYFFVLEQYEGYYNLIQNNTFNVVMNATPGGSRGVWTHRDSSSYNQYINNKMSIGGPGNIVFMLTNPGSFPGTTGHNLYSNNDIRIDTPTAGLGAFNFYDGCRSDTVQFNVIRTNSTSTVMGFTPNGGDFDGAVIRHNTFITGGATAIDFGNAATATSGSRLTSNIFYCGTANGSNTENLKVPAGTGLDSVGVFFSLGAASASKAIRLAGVDGAPGSGGGYGNSNESRWGSPRFVDSTYTTLNPALTSSSYAQGSNFRDGYAGAIAYSAGADITPPAAVSNLALSQATQSSLLASWTAPGNDGTTGTASQYDLRWSTAPITASNFSFATAVSPQPTPLAAGTAQSYVLLGLNASTTYYVALRTADAAGNWSTISNLPSAATAPDTTPPAAVKDLKGN